MFKKIIDSLYQRYGTKDVVAMTRRQTIGTTYEVDFSDYPADQREFLSKSARDVLQNEAFKMVCYNLKARILKYIRDEAPTANSIMYSRFSVNGIALVEDELASLADLGKDKAEPFDKFSGL